MNTTATLPTVQLKPPVGLVNDKREDGWELLEDTDVQGEPILELAEFLKKGETSVIGDVMFDRAVELDNRASQQHAERLLAQQDSIPEEWRKFYLVFPGTKWRHSGGGPLVPYLRWSGVKWYLGWRWLGYHWNSDCRLVRIANAT